MDRSLRKEAFNRYKATKFTSWVLAIFLAIILSAFSALGIISPFLSIPLILLVGIPAAFGVIVSHMIAEQEDSLTFSNQFIRSISFYRNGNHRSFKLISSILYSVLVFFAVNTLVSIITVLVFSIVRYSDFKEISTRLMSIFDYQDERSVEEIFGEYYNYLIIFQLISETPAVILGVSFFLYRTSINSLFIYARGTLHKFDATFISLIHNRVFKDNGRAIRKDYFSLNWPMFVIFIIFSSGLAVYFSFLFKFDASKVVPLSIASGFLPLMFFFPFYFGNMEVLFKKHEISYKRATVETSEDMYNLIRARMDLNEEEKQKLEEALEKLKNPNDEEGEEE